MTSCVYIVLTFIWSAFRGPSSHGSEQSALHSGEAKGGTISVSPELHTSHAILPSVVTTSRIPSDSEISITSAQHAYEGPVNPGIMVQPPDDVVDYWFHRLGLSFDILAETPSDLLCLSSSASVFDNIGPSVSSILVILYHIHCYWLYFKAGLLIDFS